MSLRECLGSVPWRSPYVAPEADRRPKRECSRWSYLAPLPDAETLSAVRPPGTPCSGGLASVASATRMTLFGGGVPDFIFEKTSQTGSPLTESNRRPSPYHGDALPTELRGRILSCLTWGSRPRAPNSGLHSGPTESALGIGERTALREPSILPHAPTRPSAPSRATPRPRTEVAHRLETRATVTRYAVSADERVRDALPRLPAGNRY